MVIEGQVHGGLTDGVGMALMEMIAFDAEGNCLGASLMDYLIPTALEVPDWETGHTVTPSPHHPIGAKGIGESATVGSPPAIVNAVVDAAEAFRDQARRHAVDALSGLGRHAGSSHPASLTVRDEVAHGMSARMGELLGEKVPFVHATVVRAQAPTSARPGDDAIVLGDGTIEGFVGGQCAEESVRTAALEVLAQGEALLLRVLPEGDVSFPDADGAGVVVNPCLSGGALEIFLEPVLPEQLIYVVGETSIADALAALAECLGFAFSSVRTLARHRPEGALRSSSAATGTPSRSRSGPPSTPGCPSLAWSRASAEARPSSPRWI